MTPFRLLLLVAGALIAAQINDARLLDRLLVAGVALLILTYAWSRWSVRGLALTRRALTDRAVVGERITEHLSIQNRGRIAKLWLEINDLSSLPGHRVDRVVHVRGRRSSDWSVQTVCVRRGRYRLGPLSISSGDPLGLFSATLQVPATLEVVVYPATVDVRGFPLPSGMLSGGSVTDRRSPYTTPSVAGIRDYAPGDTISRISWSATARLGRLMVKEFDHDPTSDVWIVLDLDARHAVASDRPLPAPEDGPLPVEAWLDATQEYAVTIVASLAHRCLDQGRSVGLIATGAHYEVLPAERSVRQYAKILESLAVVDADGHRPLAEVLVAEARRFTRQSTVIVVTSSTDEGWAQALAEIAGRRVRAAAIIVEPETFGPAPSSLIVVSGLVAAGIPVHLVKNGDSVSAALSGAAAIGAPGSNAHV